LTAPKRIVISGYYGLSNTGDEAVLASIVAGLREQAADELDILVLSATPGETSKVHGVRAAQRMDLRQVRQAIRGCDLFISGGGSLIQDVTSFKSLAYYLFVITMARRERRRVMVLGQGIGPLRRIAAREFARRVLGGVPLITVRDAESAEFLARIGVNRPRIEVTADPTFALDPCSSAETRALLAEAGVGPGEDVLKALALMQKTGRSRLLVAEGGKLAGVISLKDIMGYIALKLELEEM
jgi:polysaccharide pyruvyl transferase CsaB